MSLRTHLRAAYVKGGQLSIDALIALLPADVRKDRTRIASNVATLCAEKKLKRIGKGICEIDKWPANSERPPRGPAPKPRLPGAVHIPKLKASDLLPRKVNLLGPDPTARGENHRKPLITTKPVTVAGFELVPLDDGRMLINDRERRTLCACLPEPVVRRIAELVGDDD